MSKANTYIHTREDLRKFAVKHGLRPDWHEPDEQDVSAKVVGTILDNAFGARGHDKVDVVRSYMPPTSYSDAWDGHEIRVVLKGEGETAIVNLATLLAWASE